MVINSLSRFTISFTLALIVGCSTSQSKPYNPAQASLAQTRANAQNRIESKRRIDRPGIGLAERTLKKSDSELQTTDNDELCNAYFYLSYEAPNPDEKNKIETILKSRKALTTSEWRVMDKPIAQIIGKRQIALLCRFGYPSKINTLSTVNDAYQYIYRYGDSATYFYVRRNRVTDMN